MCFQMALHSPGRVLVSSVSIVYLPEVRKDKKAEQQIQGGGFAWKIPRNKQLTK